MWKAQKAEATEALGGEDSAGEGVRVVLFGQKAHRSPPCWAECTGNSSLQSWQVGAGLEWGQKQPGALWLGRMGAEVQLKQWPEVDFGFHSEKDGEPFGDVKL